MDHPYECSLSILALPLTLLEYYFTRERVTEEAQNAGEPTVSFGAQLKAIFTDKYMLLIYAYFLIYTTGSTIKNISLVYFCNYVLGTYNDGVTQTMISVIGGIPMGIGIFAVWPLAKKVRQAERDGGRLRAVCHRQRYLHPVPHQYDRHAGGPVHQEYRRSALCLCIYGPLCGCAGPCGSGSPASAATASP